MSIIGHHATCAGIDPDQPAPCNCGLEDELLEALEGMAEQYIADDGPGSAGHSFMSAGEYATRVLASRYPRRWQDTGRGVRRIGGDEA